MPPKTDPQELLKRLKELELRVKKLETPQTIRHGDAVELAVDKKTAITGTIRRTCH